MCLIVYGCRHKSSCISNVNSPYFKVDLDDVHTNIVNMYLDPSIIDPLEVVKRLATIYPTDPVKVLVRSIAIDWKRVRFTVCWEITEDDIRDAVEKIVFVIREYEGQFKGGSRMYNRPLVEADSDKPEEIKKAQIVKSKL